jgi:hypothetical protein
MNTEECQSEWHKKPGNQIIFDEMLIEAQRVKSLEK